MFYLFVPLKYTTWIYVPLSIAKGCHPAPQDIQLETSNSVAKENHSQLPTVVEEGGEGRG